MKYASGYSITLVVCAWSQAALAVTPPTLVADFDNLSEGFSATEIIDGGIRLSDLVHLSEVPYEPRFIVEATNSSSMGSLFSSPNYITFAGYSPGPGASFGRFHSARIDFPGEATAASLSLFSAVSTPSPRTVTLTAYLGNDPVTDASVIIEPRDASHRVGLGGTRFDSFVLSVTGPTGQPDYILAGIDNIRVQLVPEPSSILILLACACMPFMRRRGI